MKLTDSQRDAILHNEGNLLVSASAGSGKTFVMISRMIRLIIENKADVSEILAVTFVRTVAEEMKEKLVKALKEKINEGAGDVERLKRQLEEVPISSISTVHSFLGDLLRTYFFEAGLDPDFRIMDGDESYTLKLKAIAEVFDEGYENKDEKLISALQIFGRKRKDDELKTHIISIYDYLSSFKEPKTILDRADSYYSDAGYEKIINEIMTLCKSIITDYFNRFVEEFSYATTLNNSKLIDFLRANIECVDRMLASKTLLELKKYYIEYKLVRNIIIKKGDEELLGFKDKINALKKGLLKKLDILLEKDFLEDEYEKTLLLASKSDLDIVINLYEKFSQRYEELKRDESLVDFNDLESKSYELLKKPEIREAVKDRYKYIFVDEYQDINDLQDSVIFSISKDNLFLVGDIKQSIYAFRGCNPEIFLKKEKMFEISNGKTLKLSDNFRSAKNIIDSVNGVFSPIMNEETASYNYTNNKLVGGSLYGDYEGITSYRFFEEEVLEKKERTEKAKVYNIKDELGKIKNLKVSAEGMEIVKIIEERVGKPYYDIKSEEYKKIQYSDIVILIRNINDYTESLRNEIIGAGIPVSIDSKNNLLDYPEVLMMAGILNCIYNAKNDIPLITTLKSRIGEFSEEDLIKIKLEATSLLQDKSKKKNFYELCELVKLSDSTIGRRLQEFYKKIDAYKFKSSFISAGELLMDIMEDNNFGSYLIAEKNGELKKKRVDNFIDKAIDKKDLSLPMFLDKIENERSSFKEDIGLSGNIVKIMTMHKSKGLEFPVVILAGLSRKFLLKDLSEEIFKDEEYGLILKNYDREKFIVKENIFRVLYKIKKRFALIKEEMRLFYVAMTRAKNELYLLASSKSENSQKTNGEIKFASSFSDFLDLEKCIKTEDIEIINTMRKFETPHINCNDDALKDKIKELLNFQYPYNSSVEIPVKTSVTELMKGDKKDNYSETFIKGETSEKGTSYHNFLQYVDLFDGDLESIKQQKDKLQMSEIDENLIAKVLNLEIFKLIKGGEVFREQPFMIRVPAKIIYETESEEEVLVQGVIDLYAVVDDEIILLDYKLSKIKDENVLIQKYKKQLFLYKYALENILNKKVRRVSLINLNFAKEIVFFDKII